MNKKLKLGLCALGTIGLASAAIAANHTGNGEGNDGVTFWTIFSQDVNSSSINVTSKTSRNFTLTWDNKNVDSADYATGGGWSNVARPKSLSYNIQNWSITRTGSSGMFGVYGWSCPINAGIKGQDNVEFYIAESSINGQQFVPFDTTFKTSVSASGGTYKIYQSPSYNRANACGSGQRFQQIWAVRTGNRSVGKTNVSLDFKKISEVMDNYGYFTNSFRYLVIGVDVFKNTKGTISVGSVNKS